MDTSYWPFYRATPARFFVSLALVCLLLTALFASGRPFISQVHPAFAAPPCTALNVNAVGSATITAQNEYQLTPAQTNQDGAIWSTAQVDLSQPFFYQFEMNLGANPNGADGMAFMLQNAAASPHGGAGSAALGYAGGGLGAAGITTSLGVEFDTFDNEMTTGEGGYVYNDPGYDHTAIFRNGDNGEGDPANLIAGPFILGNGTVKDNTYHTVVITWNPASHSFRYSFDGTPIASITRDIVALDLGGSNLAYFGVTGATGATVNLQSVCSRAESNSASIADLGVTVTDGQTVYVPGGTNTYTIVVTNNGPSDVSGAVVDDIVPIQFASEDWTCLGTGGASCPASGSGGINTSLVNIPANQYVTFTVTAHLKTNASGELDYIVQTGVPSGTTDPISANDSATDIDTQATPTNTPTNTATGSITVSSTSSPTSTSIGTATKTSTSTPTNTVATLPTNTPTNTPSATNTVTRTATSTPSSTRTATVTNTPSSTPHAARIDSIGVFRSGAPPGTFFLRLHNSTGFADITVAFNPAAKPYPLVGDWIGANFDTIGVVDQTNEVFTLCTTNVTASCANASNQISFTFGNPNDIPAAGRWLAGATTMGVGVLRPSNGLIYLKNNLTTGIADFTIVLGIPGDVGVTGDWNGDSIDSPGVYRPSVQKFFLTDQVCNCMVSATYIFQYGVAGDLPITGDWIGQGHDGVGLFRQSNGFVYLKNALTTGIADITFTYGISSDVPVAGHYQLVYPPKPDASSILVAPIFAPVPSSSNSDNGPGD